MDRDFLQNRITAAKALVIAYEQAVDALSAAGGVQSYTLDTTQSRQTVTRADIPALNGMIDTLLNRVATLEARLGGSRAGSVYLGPAW